MVLEGCEYHEDNVTDPSVLMHGFRKVSRWTATIEEVYRKNVSPVACNVGWRGVVAMLRLRLRDLVSIRDEDLPKYKLHEPGGGVALGELLYEVLRE